MKLLHHPAIVCLAVLVLGCATAEPRCAPVEVVGELTTAVDKRTYKAAHIGCYMRTRKCLKKFIKLKDRGYRAICGGEPE